MRTNDTIKEIYANAFTARSPLRYPGGKTRGVEFISSFFPPDLQTILSPFFGGGSIELNAAAKGIKVVGYDVFEPLVEFWQCLLTNPLELAAEVQTHYPLAKEKFYELQRTQMKFTTKLKRAAVFYVLNRSSFSGSTLSGGMSPDHPRFTQTSIERLHSFHNSNVEVKKADFNESLLAHPDLFTYLDPPYWIKSSLYGKKGDTHKDFDHEGLAALLHQREKWILSYNDCEEIRELYEGFHILTPNWKYGMSTDKSSKEVLIFSKDYEIKGNPRLNAFTDRSR